MTTTYTLTVRRTGDHYEVTIAERAQTATGTTWQEAVDNAHRAISATFIEAVQTKQRQNEAKKRRTVAWRLEREAFAYVSPWIIQSPLIGQQNRVTSIYPSEERNT